MNNIGIIKFSDFFEKIVKDTNESMSIDNHDEDVSMNTDVVDDNHEDVSMDTDVVDDNHDEDVSMDTDDQFYSNDTITEKIVDNENYYLVYKDKSEDFSCDIQLEGSSINDAKVRLILESNDWTLMFNGDIDNKGKCIIPIKKLAILNEGLTGKIRLEVIADDTIFTPWEDNFKVKVSKKVSVKVHESKSYKNSNTKSEIKVNVKR